jgi:molybdenum-dependent DNA-binding transcriptional regulator ModE
MHNIEALLAVIEAGSQTAAARLLGRSLQSVNRSLAALERSVGVELVSVTSARQQRLKYRYVSGARIQMNWSVRPPRWLIQARMSP